MKKCAAFDNKKTKPIKANLTSRHKDAQTIPIPMHDNRDEATTQARVEKQSQFLRRHDELKSIYDKGLCEYIAREESRKTKPNKPDFMSLTSEAAGGIISVRIFGETPNGCCIGFFQGERK